MDEGNTKAKLQIKNPFAQINSKKLISLVVIVIVAAAVPTSIYLVKQRQEIRKRAQAPREATELPFLPSIDKTQITAGDSFTITLLDSELVPEPYNGYVFVKSLTCDSQDDCTTFTGQWVDFENRPVYFENGTSTINVPPDTQPQTIRIRFNTTYPKKKIQWSDEIVINIIIS